MSELKKFQRTFIDAEKAARSKLEKTINDEKRKETYNSVNHLQISFEKLLENITTEEINNNKQHIDNVYYHLGVIKGCL